MNDKPLIDTPNLPTWTVGAFVLALLALVIAFASLYRTNIVAVGTQAEVLMLTHRIEAMKSGAAVQQPAAPGAPAAPAGTK